MRTAAPDTFSSTTAIGLAALVVAAVIGLWVLSWLLLRREPGQTWRWIAVAATTGAVLTLAGGWLLTGAPAFASLMPGDWVAYHRVTAELSDGVLGGARPSRWEDRAVFFYLMALPHRAFGSSAYVTVTVNAALLGTSAVLLADLTRRLADTRTAVITAWFAAALPPFVLWSTLPHREALVLLLVVAGAWIGVRLATGPLERPWEVAGLLGSALAVALLARSTRSQILPVLALLIVLALGVRLWRWPPAHRLMTRPLGWVAAAVVLSGGLLAVGRPLHRWLDSFATQAQVAFFNLHRGTTSAIGPEPQLAPTGPIDLVVQAPLALTRALWGPPPGSMLTIQPLFVLDAAFLWLLTPFLVVGLALAVRRRLLAVPVLLLPALLWAVVSGLTLGNWGIVSRMRITTWALLLPLVAMGVVYAWERWEAWRG